MSEDIKDKVPELSAGQKMISAVSGSLFSSIIVTPFDVVRIRLQSQPPVHTSGARNYAHAQLASSSSMLPDVRLRSCCREVFFANNNAEYCLASPKGGELIHTVEEANCVFRGLQNNSFNSTFDGLKKIARNEGLTTLWRGLFPTLVMGIPANIIYFTGYDWLRFDDNSPVKKVFPETWAPLVSGSSARILAGTAVSPIEMIRTRMQAARVVGGNHYMRVLKGTQKIIAENGYFVLWRGLTLTLWRDVPFSAIYWTGYERLKKKFIMNRSERLAVPKQTDGSNRESNVSRSQEYKEATFTESFLSGAISGAFASFITMPFDVGKTRRQVFIGKKDLTNKNNKLIAPEERSMIRFLWHIFKEEGASGLWRGWTPRALKVAPACAIMISSYEVGKQSFRKMNEKSSNYGTL
ncbi:Mitochondrial carrier protein MTM1 [Erysiphe neolycopersici]|uniref:Mitochondrial carrier protein MTM1 n=1 Tax=Erysiphe neolycopersici TaxID=212602 RepID=A0A420I5G8_9PEZI|nr:Mitochondrial carrier protein MTM1 [Erysiphe neolycopersici]